MLDEIEKTVKGQAGMPTSSMGQPTPTSTMAPTPQPIQKPTLWQKTTQGAIAPAKIAVAGLGKIGEWLSKPSQWTERVLTKGKGYEPFIEKFPTLPGQIIPKSETAKKLRTELGATAARFALDPLNLLMFGTVRKPLQMATRILPNLRKMPQVEKAVQFAKTKPAIYKPMEVFAPYFRRPEAGKIIEATKRAQEMRVGKLYQQVEEASKGLSRAEQTRVGQILEGGISIGKREEKLRPIAETFGKLAERVGQEAVDLGLMAPGQFAKYKGQYMSHIWQEMFLKKPDVFAKTSLIPKISGRFFKARKGAPGYIKEFPAPTFVGLGTEMRDIEAAKMFKTIAGKFGVKEPVIAKKTMELAQKGYRYAEDISKTRGGEVLNKMLLPKEILDYLRRSRVGQASYLGKAYDVTLRAWKAGKTILNPAYHVRNIVSNQILSDMSTGRGILSTVIDYVDSVKKYLGRGNQKYVKEAVKGGMIKRRYFGEMADEFLAGAFKDQSKVRKLAQYPGKFQQFSEDTAKLNVFTEWRKRGLSVAQAIDKAQEAIFSPYKLGPTERSLMTRLVPFYSFTRQALPFTAKTLVTHPERLTKYPKFEQAIERLTEKEKPEEKYQPEWQKEMVRTPFKTKEGLTKYLQAKYFYPWGGFLEMKGLPFSLSPHPAIEEYTAQRTGIDPYFQREFVKEGMPKGEQLKARFEHLARTSLPTLYTTIKNKLFPAIQGRPDYAGRDRSLLDTILGDIFAIKMYPYDIEGRMGAYGSALRGIEKDARSEIYGIVNDKSLTPEEQDRKIQGILKRMDERFKEIEAR